MFVAATDTLSTSIALFGVDRQLEKFVDLNSMEDRDRSGEIQVSAVILRLISQKDWGKRSPAVKQLFSYLFKKDGAGLTLLQSRSIC